MRTYIMEGHVTALSSISHNGGERNGTVTQLRREKFVQPNGRVVKVPIVSGNSVRGTLRDRGMFQMLQQLGYGVDMETGEVKGLPLSAFYFLFSGGALVSTGDAGFDISKFREMREMIPLIGLFGGAAGNVIMPGKLKIGKLIPICKETEHLIPNRFLTENRESIWDYCQTEMYTRKDDEKNDRVRMLISSAKNENELFDDKPVKKESAPQQMMYSVETISAGTVFFWRVILEDVTDIEFEAFISTLLEFSKAPNIGGKGAVGHGEISIKLDNWVQIDSRITLQGTEVDMKLGSKYINHIKENGDKIRSHLNSMV